MMTITRWYSQQINRVATDIYKYVTENVIDMITKGNIDAAWDKDASNFESIGVDEYVKVYQDALDTFNSGK